MRLALVALLALPCTTEQPKPKSGADLQTACASSTECSHNADGCRYCYGGVCTCTLPADPIPSDAGVDAPGGTLP